MWSLSLLLVSQFLVFLASAEEDVLIKTNLGEIRGYSSKTVLNNVTYYGFKGIPYSKPMVGENKFNPPQPVDPWVGILDAQNHRNVCVQFNKNSRRIVGSDDCLYLNVYTPEINPSVCKPVMFWIHGGLFLIGSGDDELYGPDFLIEKDVVIVTINYRLGPIGFLSTADQYMPGNIGLKDQSHAMRWVRDNIQAFGGCSNKTTIFGQSAGAISVQYHLVSPMSIGLFDRAIQQSGAVDDGWTINHDPRKTAFRLGDLLGLHVNSSVELVNALKQMPSTQIVGVAMMDFSRRPMMSAIDYLPNIEVEVPGVERFLADSPMKLIQTGNVADVPIIAGVLLDESALYMPEFMRFFRNNKDRFLDTLREVLKKTKITSEDKKSRDLAVEIYKFYLGNNEINNDTMNEFSLLITDIAFFFPYHITTSVLKNKIKSPIYKYLLSMKTIRRRFFTDDELGNYASHSDDLVDLWFSKFYQNLPEPGSPQEHMIRIFTTLWTNFAKFSQPTLQENDIGIIWRPMGDENYVLNINMESQMQTGFFPERMNFWLNLLNGISRA